MSIFKGAGVAIVTPMKSDLEVNYDKLAELLEEQIAGKTDAIIICGTTGESATMSEEEHSKVIRFAIERVNHRIPVIAGIPSLSVSVRFTSASYGKPSCSIQKEMTSSASFA